MRALHRNPGAGTLIGGRVTLPCAEPKVLGTPDAGGHQYASAQPSARISLAAAQTRSAPLIRCSMHS